MTTEPRSLSLFSRVVTLVIIGFIYNGVCLAIALMILDGRDMDKPIVIVLLTLNVFVSGATYVLVLLLARKVDLVETTAPFTTPV